MQAELLLECLRPSALEGAWAIAVANWTSGCQDSHLTVRILSTTYSSAGFDFEAAQSILAEVSPKGRDRGEFFRAVFWEAMVRARPPALALSPRGRAAFAAALPLDAVECLRRCGVLDDLPAADALRWFDRLAAFARADLDQRKMETAREAERRSFQLETARLEGIPGAPMVDWVALDDNALGYDIRSFEPSGGGFVPKLIEVKACATDGLEFYLTRNECTVARREAHRYWLHLWNLASGRLAEVRWPDIEALVPIDTAQGQWSEARLRLAPTHR